MPQMLNELLTSNGLSLEETLIMRHSDKSVENLLPRLAFARPDEFNAYQSCHNRDAEVSLKRAVHLVSFVAVPGKGTFFVGLYENRGAQSVTKEEFESKPELQRLIKAGYRFDKWDEERFWFDLHRTTIMQEYIGRLSLRWDAGRNYTRWPKNNNFQIVRILEKPVLTSGQRI